jgi:hypothetical protein
MGVFAHARGEGELLPHGRGINEAIDFLAENALHCALFLVASFAMD